MSPAPQQTMSIRLRQELYEQLRLAAFNGKTSMSRIIAYALAEYFERQAET